MPLWSVKIRPSTLPSSINNWPVGFGYDALFYVPKYKKTLAEMTENEKNEISHRGAAFRKISKYLLEL